jgi:uncharacterized protein YjiS (DUF1127 family)
MGTINNIRFHYATPSPIFCSPENERRWKKALSYKGERAMQPAVIQQSSRHQQQHAVTEFVRQVVARVAHLSTALTVARERRALMQLDDRMLKDIGIGRSEAYREASKPFGDVSNRRLNLY